MACTMGTWMGSTGPTLADIQVPLAVQGGRQRLSAEQFALVLAAMPD